MKGVLRFNNISSKVTKAPYPIKDFLQTQATQVPTEVNISSDIPLKELIQPNRCNPHAVGQPHLIFNRQVLSGLLNPELAKMDIYSQGVRDRIEYYQKNMEYPIGAYSPDNGYRIVMKNIVKFLEKRDGVPSDPNQIYLNDGVTRGMDMVLKVVIGGPHEKILVPAPAAPLYGAIVPLKGAQLVPYHLNEEKGWSVDVNNLQRLYDEHSQKGSKVKAICVINPGNPTGKVLSHEEIRQIVDFARRNKVIIIADEVLQETTYEDKLPFISFKKVVCEDKSSPVDLFSFHSASNALQGEGGLRAGFVELFNVSDDVNEHFKKLRNMYVCSNTLGQIAIDLMVNSPSLENSSYETVHEYGKEKQNILSALQTKAKIVNDAFKDMKYVTFNEIKGGVYGFPKLNLSQNTIKEAQARNMEPDTFYVTEAHQQTGILLEPGNVFGQEEGTYHYRINTLMYPEEMLKLKMIELQEFNRDFQERFN